MRFIPVGEEEVIKFKSKNYNHGVHQWEDGISSAVSDPVPDGVVVLVRKDGDYGAFILKGQDVEPEKTDFAWFYRTDGKGFFDKKLTNVKTGSGNGKRIEFGPFNINWSGNTKGSGWLYYLRFDGSPKTPKDLYICVTGEKTLGGIDASSPKWAYKSSPYDE